MRKTTHILVHHTASAGAKTTVAGVDSFHKTKNWGTKTKPAYAPKSSLGWYVTYHYFIEWNGKLTQTRTDAEIGWHGNNANPFSIGICMAGWFDPGHDKYPTDAQIKTLTELLRQLVEKYKIKPENIVPHRKFANKTCYGSNLPDDWARNLLMTKAPLRAPYFEKVKGKSAIYAYDPDTDTMIPFASGRVFKLLFGGYDKVKINQVSKLSREVSNEAVSIQ